MPYRLAVYGVAAAKPMSGRGAGGRRRRRRLRVENHFMGGSLGFDRGAVVVEEEEPRDGVLVVARGDAVPERGVRLVVRDLSWEALRVHASNLWTDGRSPSR